LLSLQNGQAFRLFGRFEETDFSDPPIDLVDSPDGKPWGEIPDCLVPYPSTEEVKAGPIVVPLGDVGAGFVHVQRKHAGKIASVHNGMSVEDYLQSALGHYQEIYLQSDGSLVLLRTNETRKCAVVAPIVVNGILIYKLITAYPLPRKPDYSRRRAVRLAFKK
jgi:hypothetical protein